jgi:hypothetical protein
MLQTAMHVVECITELHKLGHVHGNISPRGIVMRIGPGRQWILSNAANSVIEAGQPTTVEQPTVCAPPECALAFRDGKSMRPASEKEDVWGIGIVLLEMVLLKPAFGKLTYDQACYALRCCGPGLLKHARCVCRHQ